MSHFCTCCKWMKVSGRERRIRGPRWTCLDWERPTSSRPCYSSMCMNIYFTDNIIIIYHYILDLRRVSSTPWSRLARRSHECANRCQTGSDSCRAIFGLSRFADSLQKPLYGRTEHMSSRIRSCRRSPRRGNSTNRICIISLSKCVIK